MFWKKKNKPEKKVYIIPKDRTKGVLERMDRYLAAGKDDKLLIFEVWEYIFDSFPDDFDRDKKYGYRIVNGSHIEICEAD